MEEVSTVMTFDSLQEAYMKKSLLAAHGIDAEVIGEIAHEIYPIGAVPIQLVVAAKDEQRALEVLGKE